MLSKDGVAVGIGRRLQIHPAVEVQHALIEAAGALEQPGPRELSARGPGRAAQSLTVLYGHFFLLRSFS